VRLSTASKPTSISLIIGALRIKSHQSKRQCPPPLFVFTGINKLQLKAAKSLKNLDVAAPLAKKKFHCIWVKKIALHTIIWP